MILSILTSRGGPANRVMASVTSWLERKLFLKVSSTKTKIVKPNEDNYLGFTFNKYDGV